MISNIGGLIYMVVYMTTSIKHLFLTAIHPRNVVLKYMKSTDQLPILIILITTVARGIDSINILAK